MWRSSNVLDIDTQPIQFRSFKKATKIWLKAYYLKTLHPFLLPKLTEASQSKKNDSKFSPRTKTKPVQNLFRYSILKFRQICAAFLENLNFTSVILSLEHLFWCRHIVVQQLSSFNTHTYTVIAQREKKLKNLVSYCNSDTNLKF